MGSRLARSTGPATNAYGSMALPRRLAQAGTLLASTLILTGGACKGGKGNAERPLEPAAGASAKSEKPTSNERLQLDLVAFGRITGAIAPCGCTAEPLGGMQYAFGHLKSLGDPSQQLVVEPGSLLFADPEGPLANKSDAEWAQAQERAGALYGRFSQLGDGLVSGLGPTDVSAPMGKEALQRWPMPRLLSNLDATAQPTAWPQVLRSRVVERNGLRIGALSVVDPTLGRKIAAFPGLSDPQQALEAGVKRLHEQGVDLIVASVHATRDLVEQLAQAVNGIDVMVSGGPIEHHDTARLGGPPRLKGDTWVVQPGDQQQTVTHVALNLDAALLKTKAKDRVPAANAWKQMEGQAQREAEANRVRKRLDKFKSDPSADRGFIANLERQLAALERQTAGGKAKVEVTIEQNKITCHLAKDATAQTLIDKYDAWVSDVNAKRFAGVKPKPPEAGKPHYVGMDECADCHDEAVEFWKTTVHARAWETLEVGKKEFDLACVGCHVTGFRQPGGSELVENLGLRDVQCEQCHGAGSIHVDDPETDNIQLKSPDSVCLECHTQEHSDTFDYTAYMRDILGPGHGQEARAKLGPGKTGHELRAAALKKAGGACKKM